MYVILLIFILHMELTTKAIDIDSLPRKNFRPSIFTVTYIKMVRINFNNIFINRIKRVPNTYYKRFSLTGRSQIWYK